MDLRVRYTKKIIEEAFLELLKERPLVKISVKAICEKAEINRTTYYKYYDNPYDLLNKMEAKILDDLQKRIEETNTENLQDIFRCIITDIRDKFDIYNTFFSENGDHEFRKRIFEACYSKNIAIIQRLFPMLDGTRQEWLYYFVAEGCNGVLNQWILSGMATPIDDVISFTDMLISEMNNLLPKALGRK